MNIKCIDNYYNRVMDNQQSFNIRSLDAGMMVAYHKDSDEIFLINLYERQAWMLVDSQRKLVRWSREDIDFNKVNQLPDNHHARLLQVPYGLVIDPYIRGLAKVTWTLCPAGQYYNTDEDGFDRQYNEESIIHAIINKKGYIVQRFQP